MITYSDKRYDFSEKASAYVEVARDLGALLHGESDRVANAAITTALIFDALPDLNWVGFYFMQGKELLVGPFQGKPACVRIALGKGVCGAAAAEKRTIVVPDVLAFAGHIACDAASRSEIVVPLIEVGTVLGVLDLDSPRPERFDDADRVGVERLARIFLDSLRA